MQVEWDDRVPDNLSEIIVTIVSGLSENRRLQNEHYQLQTLYFRSSHCAVTSLRRNKRTGMWNSVTYYWRMQSANTIALSS